MKHEAANRASVVLIKYLAVIVSEILQVTIDQNTGP